MHITHQSELWHQLSGSYDCKRQISLQKEKILFGKCLLKFQVSEDGIKKKNHL